jgi:membrane-associated phospholipid phosphatase
MKQALAGFLIFITGTGTVLAQKRDTVGIIHPPVHVSQIRDSLRLHKNEINFSPIIPNYDNLGEHPSLFTDNQMIYKFKIPQKKTNIFHIPYSQFIISFAFISYGIHALENDWLRKLDVRTHHEISELIAKRIRLDNYTQFAPAIAVYGLDFIGIKAKHNFGDRTFIMATSHLLMFSSVQLLKRTTKIERPDGSNFHSFPSGHTATAFVGAHILFKEYKEASPWIGVLGYAVASGTGIMRIYNKKHWISDVITGAGIGILSVEAGYLLLPVFHKLSGIEDTRTNLVITPIAGRGNYGVGLAYTF